MADKIRVATVGTGYFSQFHYDSWTRLPEVELVALCNRSPDQAHDFADKYQIPEVFSDFDQMLAKIKPDLVDIITPPVTHVEYVRKAMAKNIPAICQKPFTPSYEEAKELVSEIKACQGKVVIHENFRFQPWHRKLRELVSSDHLGQVYQVTFRLRPGDGQGQDAYLARQPYFRQMERFLVHETAIHFIDVFRYLFGEVKSLFAQLSQLNPVITGEDAGLIILNFENGVRGLIDGNRLLDHAADNTRRTMGEMLIEGENGVLNLYGSGQITFRRHGDEDAVEIAYPMNDVGFGGDCVHELNCHMVRHLLTGSPLMNRAEEYLENLRIEEAVYQSHDLGRAIDLNPNAQ